MNSTTEITEQTYIDSELNNLQTVATHDRFVEVIAIVHLEELGKLDMDSFLPAVVLPWDLQHSHYSPSLYLRGVPLMQHTQTVLQTSLC